MKKLIYGGLLFVLIGVGFVACKKINPEKRDGVVNGTSENEFGLTSLKSSSNSIEIIDGLLKFQSYDHVLFTIQNLEEKYDNHENFFINQYPDIDGDSLAIIEENVGHNEFETFEDFESSYGHQSLRKELFDFESNWLDSDQSSEEPVHPMDFIIEYGLQTILNNKAELIVADTIYKFYPYGYVQIANLDFALLEEYRSSNNPDEIKGGKVVGSLTTLKSGEDCRGHMAYPSIGWGKKTLGNARIKYKVAIRTLPWSTRYVIAKTKAYRKTGGWLKKWRKTRAHIKCSVYGSITDYTIDPETGERIANCEKQLQFNYYPGGIYSDKYNTKSWKHKVYVSTRTKSGWVKGYHYAYINGTIDQNSTLTW